MGLPPELDESTIEERRAYVKERFPCIHNCEMCGLCKVFHGQDAETAYGDYIQGKRTFAEVSADYRRQV